MIACVKTIADAMKIVVKVRLRGLYFLSTSDGGTGVIDT